MSGFSLLSCVIFIVMMMMQSSMTYADIVNKDVTRIIDASTNVIKISTSVKASISGSSDNQDSIYDIIFPNEHATNLAFISVSYKSKVLPLNEPTMTGNYTIYGVTLPDDASAQLKIITVFTNLLEPFPAEITQLENQFIRLKNSHYFYSPYRTDSQKTTIKLSSSSVQSFTKLSPFSTKGSNIQFGPYENINPFTISDLSVHYMNNFPFAKFSSMNKELEVSHWGSITVEEIYELHHAGAKLKGGFSRIDYQMSRGGQSPSFKSLVTVLPAQATNIYYRDQIGNISTSDIHVEKDGDLELEIETRFPMFGGWKTQFYIGYSIPTGIALYQDSSDRYNLKLDFYTAFENVYVEEMELKVVLPEGCSDIVVDVPYKVEQSEAKRFTYLDSELNGGRPVIILKAKNLVEEHDKQVHISYKFSQPRMLVEPLMLVVSYLLFFIACSILGRTSSVVSVPAAVVDEITTTESS